MKVVCEGIDLSDSVLKVVKACSSKTTIPNKLWYYFCMDYGFLSSYFSDENYKAKFEIFKNLLIEYNEKYNLTSITDEKEIYITSSARILRTFTPTKPNFSTTFLRNSHFFPVLSIKVNFKSSLTIFKGMDGNPPPEPISTTAAPFKKLFSGKILSKKCFI